MIKKPFMDPFFHYLLLQVEKMVLLILQTLHSLGFRKFFLADIGPLGCIPNQLATGLAPPRKCVFFVNELVKMFNTRLRSLVDQLNANHPGAIFVHGNTYGALNDILNSPINYGKSQGLNSSLFDIDNYGYIISQDLALPIEHVVAWG